MEHQPLISRVKKYKELQRMSELFSSCLIHYVESVYIYIYIIDPQSHNNSKCPTFASSVLASCSCGFQQFMICFEDTFTFTLPHRPHVQSYTNHATQISHIYVHICIHIYSYRFTYLYHMGQIDRQAGAVSAVLFSFSPTTAITRKALNESKTTCIPTAYIYTLHTQPNLGL